MKLSLSAISILLPLVAASLHPKVNNNNDKVVSNSTVLTWAKCELADYVRELSTMNISNKSFSKAFNMEKILMKTDYSKICDEGYYALLAERVVTFAVEAEIHGLEIEQSIVNLLESFGYSTTEELLPHLMNSNSAEVKAAAFSLWAMDEPIFETYFPIIEKDEKAQKRLLEVIMLEKYVTAHKILVFWGRKLLKSVEKFEIKFYEANFTVPTLRRTFNFYAQYSMQTRGMSPKEVVIEFLSCADFADLFSSLASKYEPTETSIELDGKFVSNLLSESLRAQAKSIMGKSKFRDVPNGDMRLLRTVSKYAPRFCGRYLVAEHVFNVAKIEDFDYSKEDEVKKLLNSGHHDSLMSSYEKLLDHYPKATRLD